ncbi:hypothetical protein [Chitinophaga qingshengii]|uniref:GIY-YIG nuclease family protein n=1 Tax=Chitinophaga qingshengii TaxID=1569794 RepID=A0ABR7TVK5_9BACT|nr:hypothetical protein [Chitinophaga qingshengii]MBC9934521.1 hypothetical protein [Chitinophaga qingshengii]
MSHNMIEQSGFPGMQHMQLFKKDNNMDGRDNLDTIPQEPAVYAICGRVNGAPANPRFVGAAMNLQEAVRAHFSAYEQDTCLRTFMQSIKLKDLVFEIIDTPSPQLLEDKGAAWIERLKPACNEMLNKVY